LADLQAMKILIVDDEKSVADSTVPVFERSGHSAKAATVTKRRLLWLRSWWARDKVASFLGRFWSAELSYCSGRSPGWGS